ncbi:hypothetical protein O3M35_012762 [Rhynocoris fuscipes]|uniref:Zinc finger CW-type PWWP domain protein 1 n=1 Tax=Rhynocoris fuscipes TaxID=488301 RepID=A0AAW1D0U0_9HEMI
MVKKKTKSNSLNESGSQPKVLLYIEEVKPPKGMPQRECIEWKRLNRKIGFWVQCCNRWCLKWRYLNISDPADIPSGWYCSMSPDENYNSCETPQAVSFCKSELLDARFTIGSLVVAKIQGHPWWPAMVDDDPEFLQFYWPSRTSNAAIYYHVVFFDVEEVSRAWVKRTLVKPFNNCPELQSQTVAVRTKKRLDTCIAMAKSAAKLNVLERLKKHSFISRFFGPVYSYKHDIDRFVKEHNLPPFIDSDEEADNNQPVDRQTSNDDSKSLKRKMSSDDEEEIPPEKKVKTGENDDGNAQDEKPENSGVAAVDTVSPNRTPTENSPERENVAVIELSSSPVLT